MPVAEYMEGMFNTTLIMKGNLTQNMSIDLTSLDASGFIETLNGKLKSYPPLSKLGTTLQIKEFQNIDFLCFTQSSHFGGWNFFFHDEITWRQENHVPHTSGLIKHFSGAPAIPRPRAPRDCNIKCNSTQCRYSHPRVKF